MDRKRKIAAVLGATAIMSVIGTGGAVAQQSGPDDATMAAVKAGPDRPWGCQGLRSVGNERSHATYVATVCRGKVYVLTVNESTSTPTPVGGWQFVGGPRNVVDVSLASGTQDVSGGPIFITVQTERGKVKQGVCANTVPLGTCTFTKLPSPPH